MIGKYGLGMSRTPVLNFVKRVGFLFCILTTTSRYSPPGTKPHGDDFREVGRAPIECSARAGPDVHTNTIPVTSKPPGTV